MSDEVEVATTPPPHLMVMYRIVEDKEEFQWGVSTGLPVLHVIGTIPRAQEALRNRYYYGSSNPTIHACDAEALVIEWDKEYEDFKYYAHEDTPVNAMCGMLEMIKYTLVSTHMARQMAQQQLIVGPDGQPFRR